MLPWERLRDKLVTLEGKPTQAYKSLEGEYRFDRYVLSLDLVAQDPAVPSFMRVRIDRAEARFPEELSGTRVRKTALEDFVARRWHETIRKVTRNPRGGRAAFAVEAGGQHILERTACRIAEDWIEVRGTVTWPSDGRKAVPKIAQAMIFEDLPQLVNEALFHGSQNPTAVQRHVHLAEDVEALHRQLTERNLIAFVADGAVLARDAATDKPLLSHLVPWQSPPEVRTSLALPHRGEVAGMGIPRGITVIIGPPLSGRSTLLRGIASAVYAHVPGDGREFCGTVPDAVLVASDESRRVEGVNLHPFVTALPSGEDVTQYRTEHALPVVSQTATLVEALEAGCAALLIDEDLSAPGLLAQDALLRQLVPASTGHVLPLVDLFRPLYEEHGISAVIVTSAPSAYARIADTIIAMDRFHPTVVTTQARQLAGPGPSDARRRFGGIHHRVPLPESVNQLRGRKLRPEMAGPRSVTLGRDSIDLARQAQLVDPCQARAAGAAIVYAAEQGYVNGSRTVREILALIDSDIMQRGLDVLAPPDLNAGDLARPRRQEMAAAFNRLRTLRVKS